MIKVYQIRLSDEDIAAANRGETYTNPKVKAYYDRSFISTFKAENFQYYTHVANVLTTDREDAFQLMNLWEDESLVERLGPCSSMSVGDIVEMENGNRYRCASFGFEEI